jgi:cell division protein FtsW
VFKRKTVPQVKPRGENKHIDYPLLIVILALTGLGALMVYSGSAIVAVKQGYEPYYYFLRQITWIGIGLVAGFIMFKIDYHLIAKFALPGLITAIALLVAVLLINHGSDIKRWINLGPFPLQPSELAKITFLLYLSTWLSKQREKREVNKKEIISHIKHELLPFILLLGTVCGLIVVEPDLDTTVMLGMTSFIIYLLSGSDVIHVIGAVATAIISSIIAIVTTLSAQYRVQRFQTYLDFWKNNTITDPYNKGYQFLQILIAIASGGLFGVGFGNSTQKYNYLGDTAFSDTIYAIFAEEFGLIGGILLILAFVFIFIRGYKIAVSAKDKLGFLIAISMSTWIIVQAFFHIGSNVGLFPLNGNTLPFMSYGGSSTVVNLMAMGLLLNVARFADPDKKIRIEEDIDRKPAITKRNRRLR